MVTDNAAYENFMGSVSIGGSVDAVDGETVVTATTASHQWQDGEAGGVLDTGWFIPEDLPAGSYTGRLWVRLANGSLSSLEVPISVQ